MNGSPSFYPVTGGPLPVKTWAVTDYRLLVTDLCGENSVGMK